MKLNVMHSILLFFLYSIDDIIKLRKGKRINVFEIIYVERSGDYDE